MEPVTVTVTNYNGAAFLEDCLASIAALRGPVAEVLLVDNASTDDGVARARARFPDVRVIALPDNRGPCVARNRGLAEAKTRWVLQVDSDVVLREDVLERLLPETGGERVAIVQPRAVLASDPGVIHYDGGSFHYVGVMRLPQLMAPVAGAPVEPRDVDAVISMALLVDREVVLDAGGYDEAFFILFEDHDLSYRLRAAGHRLRAVPDAVVLHREGTVGLSYRPGAPAYPARRAFLHARNRTYLVLKNYGWPALIASFPGRLVYGTVWALFALRRGVLGAYVKGRWDLLRLLPRALAARRILARRRVVGDRRLLGAEPLTFSPVIPRGGSDAILERALDGVLRVWWSLARRALPNGPLPPPEPR